MYNIFLLALYVGARSQLFPADIQDSYSRDSHPTQYTKYVKEEKLLLAEEQQKTCPLQEMCTSRHFYIYRKLINPLDFYWDSQKML